MHPKSDENSDQRAQRLEHNTDSNAESNSMIETVIRALAGRGIFAFRWDEPTLPMLQGTWDAAQLQ
jgi:hypothetical protein